MNRVILIGRLVADADLRYTQSGQAVTQFTLAVDKSLSREKRQEMEAQGRPTADFPRIVVWGVQGENVSKYLHKGSQCAVQGRIQTGSYEDNNGKTIYTTDVFADTVEFLDSRNDAQNSVQANNNRNRNNYTSNQSNSNEDYFGDDFEEVTDDGRIPF